MFWSFLIVSCFLSVHSVASANGDPPPPPRFVYRADFRDPDDIFRNGMASLGTNANLLDHVDGRSCHYNREANSAFIATSAEQPGARHWASEQLRTNPNEASIYVYRIRASSNFYNVYESLIHAFRQTRDDTYRSRADRYRFLAEWVAHSNIPANQIESVTRYERDQEGRSVRAVGGPRRNRRYRNRRTRGNTNPFDVEAVGNTDDVHCVPSNFAAGLTACFAACTRPSSSDRRTGTTPNTCSIPTIFTVDFSHEASTVWDPTENRPVKRLVPWLDSTGSYWEKDHIFQRPSNRRFCPLVEPGNRSQMDILQVKCEANDFFEKFVVVLKAGGSWYNWVDQKYTVSTGTIWKKWSREIPVVGTNKNLHDYDYTILDVFVSGKGWWSEIRVLPIYPIYRDVQED